MSRKALQALTVLEVAGARACVFWLARSLAGLKQ